MSKSIWKIEIDDEKSDLGGHSIKDKKYYIREVLESDGTFSVTKITLQRPHPKPAKHKNPSRAP